MNTQYFIRVHLDAIRFSIRKYIADQLGLAGGNWIHLSILEARTKTLLYRGDLQMKSGLEIYGPELLGKLKKGQAIIVKARRSRKST